MLTFPYLKKKVDLMQTLCLFTAFGMRFMLASFKVWFFYDLLNAEAAKVAKSCTQARVAVPDNLTHVKVKGSNRKTYSSKNKNLFD